MSPPARPGGGRRRRPDPAALARLRQIMDQVPGGGARAGGRRGGEPFDDEPVAEASWDGPDAWDPGELADPDPDPYDDDEQYVGRWRRRRWEREAPAKPIRVAGGLVARSRWGAVGETWWSQRFLAAVEAASEGGRSTRGRTYARQGQVLDFEVAAGLITARVQGTRRVPYETRIAMPAAGPEEWERIVAALAGQAGYAARLLAGDLPHELEEVFLSEGVDLFPSRTTRMSSACTCPDWSVPCKHVAAACYLVAEAFDRDPFLLLAWRGRDREALLAELRRRRGGDAPAPVAGGDGQAAGDGAHAGVAAGAGPTSGEAGAAGPATGDQAPFPAPPLAECAGTFWSAGPDLAAVRIRPEASPVPGAILRSLPPGVLVVQGRDLAELLEPAYAVLAAEAERRAFGDGPVAVSRPAPGSGPGAPRRPGRRTGPPPRPPGAGGVARTTGTSTRTCR